MGEYCFGVCGLTGEYKVGCEELDDVDRSLDRNDEDEVDDGKLDDDDDNDVSDEPEFKPENEDKEYWSIGDNLLGQICNGLVNEVDKLDDVELKFMSCDIAVWRIVDESDDKKEGSVSPDGDCADGEYE